MAFPADLPTLPEPSSRTEADGTTLRQKLVAIFTTYRDSLNALMVKVGIDGSASPTSIDYRLSRVVETVKTASYTLALVDAGTIVAMDVATANTVTIPANAAVAFPIGTVIEGYRKGAGVTSTVAAAGVTIVPNTALKAREVGSTWGYRKRATDEWVISGDLIA